MDEKNTSPLARGRRVPRPSQPPGLIPRPRVVFRTRRKNLSHENRVKRLDGMGNLAEWYDYADRFIRESGSLDAEAAAYLIDRGFDADKSRLYALPREDVDDYLSDLQVRLLPYANGADAPILENRQLFRQVFRGILEFVPLVATIVNGEIADRSNQPELSDREIYRVLPLTHWTGRKSYLDVSTGELFSADGKVPCRDIFGTLREMNLNALVLGAPRSEIFGDVRVFVVRDPKSALPKIIAAVVSLPTPSSWPLDSIGSGAISASINVETGTISSVKRLVDGAPADAGSGSGSTLIGQAVPHWWELQHQIYQALLRLPMFSVLQVDFCVAGERPLVVDATARVDAAEFQIHGPLMGTQVCRRLMREYGL